METAIGPILATASFSANSVLGRTPTKPLQVASTIDFLYLHFRFCEVATEHIEISLFPRTCRPIRNKCDMQKPVGDGYYPPPLVSRATVCDTILVYLSNLKYE